jgi:hypothetical protein
VLSLDLSRHFANEQSAKAEIMNRFRHSILCLSFILAACHQTVNDEELKSRLVKGASKLNHQRETWLAAHPRKSTVMNLADDGLPPTLQVLGYDKATADEGYVLFSKDRKPKRGFLVFTHGEISLSPLEQLGFEFGDTSNPAIKGFVLYPKKFTGSK